VVVRILYVVLLLCTVAIIAVAAAVFVKIRRQLRTSRKEPESVASNGSGTNI